MSFTSAEFRDLLRLLEQHPEWREELRRVLLTDELLSLPQIVRDLARAIEALVEAQRRTEERVGRLEDRVERLEDRMERVEEIVRALAEAQRHAEERLSRLEETVAALAEAQRQVEKRVARLEEIVATLSAEVAALAQAQQRAEQQIAVLAASVDALTRRMDAISQDVARLKGFQLQYQYERHAPAYFRALARKIHVLSAEELSAFVESAVEGGRLTDSDADEIIRADIVARGRHPEEGSEIYLVIEVSWGIGLSDVERAARRALLLSHVGVRAIPVVAGEGITEEAAHLARQLSVWRVIDGRAIPPMEFPPIAEA